MFNSQKPNIDDLPTKKQLFISTIIAIIVAAVILITVVLPSEYGVDITGIGSALGLKKMGEIKTSLEKEANSPKKNAVLETNNIKKENTKKEIKSEKLQYEIKPGKAIEIKLVMDKASKVTYKWSCSTGSVNYDLHGDSKVNDFISYKKGRSTTTENGTLVAKFTGNHGWWWKNIGNETLTITLEISGAYKGIKKFM